MVVFITVFMSAVVWAEKLTTNRTTNFRINEFIFVHNIKLGIKSLSFQAVTNVSMVA